MRRQATTSRAMPAGSSRGERLDPFALPLRFEAARPRRRRAGASGRAPPRARRAAPGPARHQDGGQPAGRRLSRRGDPHRAADAGDARAPSPSCSSIPIRPCRSRFIAPPTAATSWRNGSPGAARWPCRSWSPKPTAACASRSSGSARSASARRIRAAGDRHSTLRARRPIACRCGGRPALHGRR